jgi:N6-adenosine-specific RNA methylase IME4
LVVCRTVSYRRVSGGKRGFVFKEIKVKITEQQARDFTEGLGSVLKGSWQLIKNAKDLGVPQALGMSTEEWVRDKLGGYTKLPKEERQAAAMELKEEGYSTRESAEILGVDHSTIVKDFGEKSPVSTPKGLENSNFSNKSGEKSPFDRVAKGDDQILLAAKQIKQEKAADKRIENDMLKVVNPLIIPDGQYSVIIVDPPWPMEKIERDVRPNQVAFEYPTMSETELVNFDLSAMAADDCHLFCWTTQKFFPMALKLLSSWGFRYVCTMVWHKPGGFQPIGLPQYNCEFVLYARRGSPKFIDTKAFSCCFTAVRSEHSRKPGVFYSLVRRVTDGPRIDVFSREPREGFDQFGNEVDKFSSAR